VYYALWLSKDMVGAEIPDWAIKELQSGFEGSFLEDAFIKVTFRNAVLKNIHSCSFIPNWVVHDTFLELYSAKRTGEKFRGIINLIYQGFVSSAKDTAPHLGALAPFYAISLHPFYLMGRTIGLRYSNRKTTKKR